MDDVSKRAKLLGNSRIGLYSCLFISTPQLSKEKRPPLKRFLPVSCWAVQARFWAFLMPIQRWAWVKSEWCSLVSAEWTQPPSTWFDQQGLWEGVAFKEQSERSWGSGDYQAEKVETLKDDSAFDFPGGPVVQHLPCNVRDTGSISRSGRFHRRGSNWAHVSQLLSPCTAKKNPLAPTKVPCAATEAWHSQVKKERS